MNTRTQYGKCQDRDCEEPEEVTRLQFVSGIWRCDGCAEAEWDQQDFNEANWLDISDN